MFYYHRVISEKNGYDLNAYNNVRDILSNTDVITNIVKSIVHSPAGKIIINNNYMLLLLFLLLLLLLLLFFFWEGGLISPRCEQT